jgi:hypothetical protein
MYSPYELDLAFAHHRRELLREAAEERLARLAVPRRASVRGHLAAALHALADRIDSQCQVATHPHQAAISS